jgi:hypothetical protein
MKEYRGADLLLQAFLFSTLDKVGGQLNALTALPKGVKPHVSEAPRER